MSKRIIINVALSLSCSFSQTVQIFVDRNKVIGPRSRPDVVRMFHSFDPSQHVLLEFAAIGASGTCLVPGTHVTANVPETYTVSTKGVYVGSGPSRFLWREYHPAIALIALVGGG